MGWKSLTCVELGGRVGPPSSRVHEGSRSEHGAGRAIPVARGEYLPGQCAVREEARVACGS